MADLIRETDRSLVTDQSLVKSVTSLKILLMENDPI